MIDNIKFMIDLSNPRYYDDQSPKPYAIYYIFLSVLTSLIIGVSNVK